MAAEHAPLQFRPHIAGLRALAVMGVVLFHFGAGWLPGGFVGVDIFFVISGFLISKSIFRETEQETFSLVAFYERRAKRILPALFVITILTATIAFAVLFPVQLVAFAKSMLAAATFSSNIYFYASTDYFSPAAIETPLLHYWSLGVEEQFYLFFPLIVLSINRCAPRTLGACLVVMLAVSLAACQSMLSFDPSGAFYLLPFRACELLIGSVLAHRSMHFPETKAYGEWATAAGLALLIASFALINEATRFPGLTALPPCLGAALVIWGAERVPGRVARWLSVRPLKFLGAISYSLYLVHWPIAVFGKMLMPAVSPIVFLIGGTLASVAIAWLSFAFVEQPARKWPRAFGPRIVFGLASASLLLMVAMAYVAIDQRGFPGRLNGEEQRILTANNGNWQFLFRDAVCFLRPEQRAADLDERTCLPDGRPDVLLWGSSRIAQFYRGLEPLLLERGLTLGQITASACPPHLGRDIAARPNCRPMNDATIERLRRMKPKLVIIGGDGLDAPEEREGLDRTIAALTGAGIRTVVLGPMVTHRQRVPNVLAARLEAGNRDKYSGGDTVPGLAAATDAAATRFKHRAGITYISPRDDICEPQGCLLQNGADVLYYDEDHFTLPGTQFYARRLLALIEPDLRSIQK